MINGFIFRFEPNEFKIVNVNHLPSTKDVKSVTFAALRLPAGNAKPILSSLSRKNFPPFLDFALKFKNHLLIPT